MEINHFIFICGDAEARDGGLVSAFNISQARLKRQFWPIYTHTRHRNEIKAGDTCLFYLAGKNEYSQCFFAEAIIEKISEYAGLNFEVEKYELSKKVPRQVLFLENIKEFSPVPIRPLLHKFSFIKKSEKLYSWGLGFIGGCKKITANDYMLISDFANNIESVIDESDDRDGMLKSSREKSEETSILNNSLESTISRDLIKGDMLEANNGEIYVPVHYATNRKATGKVEPNNYFGSVRNDKLNYGRLYVSIPANHEIGEMERPSIWQLWRESSSKHIVLRKITRLEKDDFFDSLSDNIKQLDEHTAFIFIHGFNVSFPDAARRAAQMAFDMFWTAKQRNEAVLAAVPILFSWPSVGNFIAYPHDSNNSEASATFFKSFLTDVVQRSGAKTIVIIAHSMGNRVLTHALKEIGIAMQNTEGPLVKEIILAAPDIDRDIFKQAANAVMRTCGRATLYASANDWALKASKEANGYPRAGDMNNDVLIIDGMDTIDASEMGNDIFRHSYYGSTTVISDLYAIITRDDPPGKRFGLLAVGKPPNQYWRFRKRAK